MRVFEHAVTGVWCLAICTLCCHSLLKTFLSCSATTRRPSWRHGLSLGWHIDTATYCTTVGRTFLTACCSCSVLNFLPKSLSWYVLLPARQFLWSKYLRSAVHGHLTVPRYRLTTAGRRAFSLAGPSAWNCLPAYLKNETLTLDSFKRYLKCFLFDS